ncbi:alpha/beta fold hydrolase [Chitinophaga sp. S165]|uniref:alpha/beta fold hydrolase n=1 Tax=Chitinophaga sp. S165 TaxID=2135462 RepID=UPI000D714B35|nr:alpha/beta hydrolase [Chitinophaga sp. S165]PWV56830.1 pimeloyl-ACP methyl ester carboxylesterase [Chitinophaga sp. S165]
MKTIEETNAEVFTHETVPTSYVDVKNVKFAYRAFGKKVGVPLIFLQHFTGTMDNWDPAVTNAFAQNRYVILFNNKGVASSEGSAPDSVAEMAKDAIDFIDALGYEQVDLLGFSLGGFIAQEIVANRPSLVRKLILAGTGPIGSAGITQLEAVIGEGMKDGPENALINLFFTKSEEGISAGRAFMKRLGSRTVNRDVPNSGATIGAQAKAIITYGYQQDNGHQQLAGIKHPVLIVNGTSDLIVPTLNSFTLAKHLQNSKLIVWSDAGHGGLFQYHEDFNREAEFFLGSN